MIILLDIDGVMVPASNWKTPEFLNDGFPNFSPRAINSLNKIILKTMEPLENNEGHDGGDAPDIMTSASHLRN